MRNRKFTSPGLLWSGLTLAVYFMSGCQKHLQEKRYCIVSTELSDFTGDTIKSVPELLTVLVMSKPEEQFRPTSVAFKNDSVYLYANEAVLSGTSCSIKHKSRNTYHLLLSDTIEAELSEEYFRIEALRFKIESCGKEANN